VIGHNLRESGKLSLRRALQRANLSIGRDPMTLRLVRTLDSLRIETVLDVGANVGQFATLLRSGGYLGRIVSFEPLPDAFTTLERRASRDALWEARQVAIGERSGSSTIHVSRNSYSSSLLTMNQTHLAAAPDSTVVEDVDVALETLTALLPALGLNPERTLLKIDAQGYEGQVLDGAGNLPSEVAAIQLEMSFVPLYEGQVLFDDLRARLERTGLTLYSLEPGISDARGRLLQSDGLFVRTALLD
jgi:FkbM family methyltransferase